MPDLHQDLLEIQEQGLRRAGLRSRGTAVDRSTNVEQSAAGPADEISPTEEPRLAITLPGDGGVDAGVDADADADAYAATDAETDSDANTDNDDGLYHESVISGASPEFEHDGCGDDTDRVNVGSDIDSWQIDYSNGDNKLRGEVPLRHE